MHLDAGRAEYACIVTTDLDAGNGAVAALEANGFEDRVQFKHGFESIEEIT